MLTEDEVKQLVNLLRNLDKTQESIVYTVLKQEGERKKKLAVLEFREGDRVQWSNKRGKWPKVLKGTVTKVKKVNIAVQQDNSTASWICSARLLTKLTKEELEEEKIADAKRKEFLELNGIKIVPKNENKKRKLGED